MKKNLFLLFSISLASMFLIADTPEIDIAHFLAIATGDLAVKPGKELPDFDQVTSIEIEPVQNTKSLSVIIPCHYAHAKHLYGLLRMLEEQTVLPDEVVISLSEYTLVPQNIMQQLEESRWAFPVTIILSEQKLPSSKNRNVASAKARGDIFMYQDADDQPHPQRVEIIKFCFEKFNLDILMHRYIELHKEMQVALPRFERIDFMCPSDYNNSVPGKDIHNGNTAISRNVFKAFKWPDIPNHEDEIYNKILYKYFGNRMLVYVPLIIYRNYLSVGYRHNLDPAMLHGCESNDNTNKKHHINFAYNALLYEV